MLQLAVRATFPTVPWNENERTRRSADTLPEDVEGETVPVEMRGGGGLFALRRFWKVAAHFYHVSHDIFL